LSKQAACLKYLIDKPTIINKPMYMTKWHGWTCLLAI